MRLLVWHSVTLGSREFEAREEIGTKAGFEVETEFERHSNLFESIALADTASGLWIYYIVALATR